MAGELYSRWGITQPYGAKNSAYAKGYNRGQDYGGALGTPVPLEFSGTVVSVSEHPQWGTYVQVRDGNGYIHQYSHLSEASVSPGQRLGAGETVGKVGYSGWTIPAGPGGAHLDYMVLDRSGNDIDPNSYQGHTSGPAPASAPRAITNPNQSQQVTDWRAARRANGEDPNDVAALNQHLSAIGAPQYSGSLAGGGEDWDDGGGGSTPTEPSTPTGGSNMADPQPGTTRNLDLGDGRKQSQIFRTGKDEWGEPVSWWDAVGGPYTPKADNPKEFDPERETAEERRQRQADESARGWANIGQGSTPGERMGEGAADRRTQKEINADKNATDITIQNLQNEVANNRIEMDKTIALIDDAFKRDNLVEVQRQFDILQGLREREFDLTTKVEEAKIVREDLRVELEVSALTGYYEGEKTLTREQIETQLRQKERELNLKEGELTGRINGAPTLEREEWEAKLANEPGNVYNYLLRSRGMEPQLEQSAAPGPSRPWWENYSNERLMAFPDAELMTLPPAVLAKFPNEFFLERPAMMAFLPPERIKGEGEWSSTGFADAIIDKYGKGAPIPKSIQNVGKAYVSPSGTAPTPMGAPTGGTATGPNGQPMPGQTPELVGGNGPSAGPSAGPSWGPAGSPTPPGLNQGDRPWYMNYDNPALQAMLKNNPGWSQYIPAEIQAGFSQGPSLGPSLGPPGSSMAPQPVRAPTDLGVQARTLGASSPAPQPMGQSAMIEQARTLAEQIKQEMAGVR